VLALQQHLQLRVATSVLSISLGCHFVAAS
jgi:hypothetical protein